MLTDKQILKQLHKLIEQGGYNRVHTLFGDIQEEINQIQAYKQTFENKQSATAWFKKFCTAHNLSCQETYNQKEQKENPQYEKYGKSRLTITGWDCSSPYFMLWLNNDSESHIEIGESLEQLWIRSNRLDHLEKQMENVIHLKNGQPMWKIKEEA